MTPQQSNYANTGRNRSSIVLAAFALTVGAATLVGTALWAVELPPELPLWEKPPSDYPIRQDVKEQVRSVPASPGSPSGLNRAFSSVSSPTYSIHRPRNPNGVGLVICPGGGYRNVWIAHEGHDLAIWLKDHNVTCLVLKYRTFAASDKSPANTWPTVLRRSRPRPASARSSS